MILARRVASLLATWRIRLSAVAVILRSVHKTSLLLHQIRREQQSLLSDEKEGNAMQTTQSKTFNTALGQSVCDSHRRVALRLLLAGVFLSSFISCVTTTTGGFEPEASEKQAVIDYSRLALAQLDFTVGEAP